MGVSKTIDMNPKARRTIKELLQRYLPGVTVWAYGSRVKWTARPNSDLDLVIFAGKEQRGDVATLREAFEESNLPFRVDVFIWNEVPEKFREEIREGYVVVQEKEEKRHRSYAGPSLVGLFSEWEIQTLEFVCDSIFDCPHSTPKLSDDGPFMVRTQDIRNGYFDFSEAAHVSWETYRERTTRAVPTKSDILLSREGTYFGDAAEVPPETPLCLGQRMVLLRPDQSIIDSTFLRLWINSQSFQNYLTAFRDGTVAERLNVSTIRKLPVPVPSKRIQDNIVTQILPLEEKQHLNRHMNQTLEAMAQAIFKSWFVDFDPVKAKQAAKALGHDPGRAAMAALSGKLCVPKSPADLSVEDLVKAEAELEHLGKEERKQLAQTAALFPDGFVGSELSLIPEGWEVSNLENLLELVYGKALKKSDRSPGPFPVYGSGGITGQHENFSVEGPGIIIGRKGTVGSIYWEERSFFPIDTVFYVKVKEEVSLEYLFYALQILGLEAMNTDAAVPGLNRNNVHRLKVPQIPTQLIAAFTNLARSLRLSIRGLSQHSETLVELRDSLLPKLLSGELPVSESG